MLDQFAYISYTYILDLDEIEYQSPRLHKDFKFYKMTILDLENIYKNYKNEMNHVWLSIIARSFRFLEASKATERQLNFHSEMMS